MAGLNIHQTEEQAPQVGSLEDQLRLREEIERQLEAERATARTRAQETLDQEKIMRQAAARAMRQQEETRQQTVRETSSLTRKRRPYSLDALMLCAVTLGMGALLGPIMHPAPPLSAGAPAMGIPYAGGYLPAGGLAGQTYAWQNAVDEGGNDWGGSRMKVDREVTLPNGHEYVEGHADWDVSGDYVGSEQFSGEYDPSTGKLDVSGTMIEQPNLGTPVHLVPGHYTGTMTADGQLLGGYMEGAQGISAIPGHFGGTRLAP